MSVTYEEALQQSLKYFNDDELAATTFLNKYALRNNDGDLMEASPKDMHNRIAKEFARIEKDKFKTPLTEQQIFELLDHFKYVVPQGSPMFGIGNNYQTISLSNCYVAETPVDSYGGIMKTDEQLVQISKRRGGVGTDVSILRPAGARTKNAAKKSTGVVSFSERFSNSIREVGQQNRRGALMLTISIHHPESVIIDESQWDNPQEIIIQSNKELSLREIKTDSRFYNPDELDFASMKLDRKKVTGANVSIRLSDEFLEAVEKGEKYEQRFPVDYKEKGIKPLISKMVDARKVWQKIIHMAWQSAEPGLLFWDNVTKYNMVDCYEKEGFKTVCCNPCAELPLCELDSCRLMVQNLLGYVNNPFTDKAEFDYNLFFEHAKITQRLMDDVIDLELEKIQKIIDKIKEDPEEEDIKRRELELWEKIYDKCKNGRRTGLGITAMGDTLAALGLKYASEESLQVVDKIFKTQKLASYWSSVEMAKELGAFPVWNFEIEKDTEFLKQLKEEDEELYEAIKKYGRRNIANMTIAPTGSVSILTQTTSGIEPLFMIGYTRRRKINPEEKDVNPDFVDEQGDKWKEFKVYHKQVEKWIEQNNSTDENKMPWFGCCAQELDWKKRVELQSIAQRHIDHAISSTLNLPEDVSEEKVAEIYQTAWKANCKGITVYRDNCRTGVLVSNTDKKENNVIVKTEAPKRPKELPCEIHHCVRSGERFFVVVGLFNDEPYEVFANTNDDGEGDVLIPKSIKNGRLVKKSRGCYVLINDEKEWSYKLTNGHSDDNVDVLTRIISTALRHGAHINFVVHQLEKTKGDLQSVGKVLARTLKKYIEDGTKIHGETCPSCGSTHLIRQEGCVTCADCGYSKCG